jgi:hypothetical protein
VVVWEGVLQFFICGFELTRVVLPFIKIDTLEFFEPHILSDREQQWLASKWYDTFHELTGHWFVSAEE